MDSGCSISFLILELVSAVDLTLGNLAPSDYYFVGHQSRHYTVKDTICSEPKSTNTANVLQYLTMTSSFESKNYRVRSSQATAIRVKIDLTDSKGKIPLFNA